MKKVIIFVITIIIILAITVIFLISPAGNGKNEIKVEIPLGTGSSEIATILKENDLIRSKNVFKLYVKFNNISNFQAGTYYLKDDMTLKEISEVLQTGVMYNSNQITITYLEGKNMRWLAEKIEAETNNTAEDVYNLLQNETYINLLISKYWFITEDIKNTDIYYPLEGYLFPDTYAIENKDTTVEEIFEKMLDKMESVLDEYKNEIENSKYSIHELLTIASIVEMEAMNEVDRAGVASVIYNRLSSNMAIQSDVTTYYALKIDMGERDLYQTEIDTYNGYNTRGPNMAGKLPVGPISSVSASSIRATIQPENTDYLFFVADKNGKVYFSRNNSEHDQIIRDLKTQGLWYIYE